jgi:hypothetical protein
LILALERGASDDAEDELELLLPMKAAGSVGVEEGSPMWVFERAQPPVRHAVAVAPRPEKRLEDKGPRLAFTVREERPDIPNTSRRSDVGMFGRHMGKSRCGSFLGASS